ncbi:hypothetical protein HK102_006814 [Quaeritorhiza haematococci]|nr:hypothetical protein HK102_006814 [Quaeritorhiza haematococci]
MEIGVLTENNRVLASATQQHGVEMKECIRLELDHLHQVEFALRQEIARHQTVEELQNALQNRSMEVSGLHSKLGEATKSHQEAIDRGNDLMLQSEVKALTDKNQHSSETISVLLKSGAYLQQQVEILTGELETFRKDATQLEDRLRQITRQWEWDVENHAAVMKEKDQVIASKEEVIAAKEEAMTTALKQLEELRKEKEDLEAVMKQKEFELRCQGYELVREGLRKEVVAYSEEVATLLGQRNQATELINEFTEAIKEKMEIIERQAAQIETLKKETSDLRVEVEMLEALGGD